ncbi:MAG: hypothetical protein DRI84_02795, partial [Bacteroidetes bacterium]
SDSKQSWAAGGNESTVTFHASKWDSASGQFAIEATGMSAGGSTEGGTLAWAKQTKDKAFVASVTGNTGSAWSKGADNFTVETYGHGGVSGYATLPNLGYAAYNATFEYTGGNRAYGVAGGFGSVKKVGKYGTTSSAGGFAYVSQSERVR